ncbi:MAG: hypothetical protein ABSG81_08545 [Acidimicrobiales bacterium]|jgi:hypothetical protein
MLCIEYDVNDQGDIELVALINVVDEDGLDPQGEEWLAWRAGHDDEGMGCVAVTDADLEAMESTESPEALCAMVERIILSDRQTKEVAR